MRTEKELIGSFSRAIQVLDDVLGNYISEDRNEVDCAGNENEEDLQISDHVQFENLNVITFFLFSNWKPYKSALINNDFTLSQVQND